MASKLSFSPPHSPPKNKENRVYPSRDMLLLNMLSNFFLSHIKTTVWVAGFAEVASKHKRGL